MAKKEIPNLVALERTGSGKGAARQARRDGMVPGVVFGGDKDPVSLNLPFNDLLKKLKAGRFKATLWNLQVEGQPDSLVICRDVQRDVVKDLPIHVDFMRLRARSKVALYIPVEFINEEEAPGIRKGGVLTVVRPEIELEVTASAIPDHVTVDLTGLAIGDVITISDVKLPAGVKPTIDRDFVICNISAPSGLAADDEEEGAEGEADEAAEADEAGAEE